MAYTISTHNGSTVARRHNMRDKEIVDREKHIDPRGHHETWMDNDPSIAYKALFGEAVEKYNQKQTRNDRKIDDYYQKIKRSKDMHPVYEVVVSIGSAKNQPDKELGREILLQYTKEWKEHNPNLVMIGAYYHADEIGVPHVHIDYVPVAHGYKKGPDTQPGLVKAFGEQGLHMRGRGETAQIQWERKENDRLEKLCNERGLDVIHPQRGKEVKHVHKEEYILQKELERYHSAVHDLSRATDALQRADRVLTQDELPDWIQKKGILSTAYVVQAEDIDRVRELLAADTLQTALKDVQRAYEQTAARLLESEREALTREIKSLEHDMSALERRYRNIAEERDMAMEKVHTQDKEIQRMEEFIADHDLTHEYEREHVREWSHEYEHDWEIEW